MGKILKFLDGWKLVIAFVLLVGVKAWDAAQNGHAGDVVGLILSALGWAPPEWTAVAAGEAAAYVLGLIAIFHKVLKARSQAKAGARVSELLSAQGYVKGALDDGTLRFLDSAPVVRR